MLCACMLMTGWYAGPVRAEAAEPYASGDVVTYGRYYTRGDGQLYPIDWIVIRVLDGKVFLISKYALEAMPLNKGGGSAQLNWGNSSLRKWLNETFLETAFSEEERKSLVETEAFSKGELISADLVTLPTGTDAYIMPESERACEATEYVREVCRLETEDGKCDWFLRDISNAYLGIAGAYTAEGKSGTRGVERDCGIRPMIVADLGTVQLGTPVDKPEAAEPTGETAVQAVKGMPSPGQVITFGKYSMEDVHTVSPIEWIVLGVQDDAVLAVSLFALDSGVYCAMNDLDFNGTTWADCSLRKWLNGIFMDDAFSGEEKKALLYLNMNNDDGTNTSDRVMILSGSEAGQIFRDLRCAPTNVLKEKGGLDCKDGYCSWWVRTNGPMPGQVRYFDSEGNYKTTEAYDNSIGIRPFIAIDKAWFE